jgi:hypothetical protein
MDAIPGSTLCRIQSGDIFTRLEEYEDPEIIPPYFMASAEKM